MERTRNYECMCLLDNREVRKGWDSLKDAVAGLFTKHDAKVLSSRRWDERRLAYPINGQIRATYLLVYFSMDTQALPNLRRELQFSEPTLRYMITDCEDIPADAYEPEAEFDVNAIPEDDAPDVVEPEAPVEEAPTEGAAAEEASDKPAEGDAKDGDAEKGDAEKAEGGETAGSAATTEGGEESKS